ncbi:MAG: dephospho-CoA kinase [Mycoplasmataceae bacterium]|nr:dephospho-CoA kinase [Mycoplasmataceae bacterium]
MILITGLSGVGKSLILKESLLKNVHYMDDVIKSFYKRRFKLYWDIKKEFGSTVIGTFKVNTKKLGTIVFNDAEKMKRLDLIVKPYIETYLNILKQDKKNQHIIEMAIYMKYESWYSKYFSKVILVDRSTNLGEKFKYMDNKKQPLKMKNIKYDLIINDSSLSKSIKKLIEFLK